ncbi:regulatory protein TetR [Spirochaeta thermophila DSM 6578]|uniref:Regulatory protein TetR n=1 Tax=Winmispira thermophila (strain ATCC 700085 / DSM 6578 / Z-1203) TaxID=869211 RepID=G0GB64_WINT7|nr:TetR/AcrR family transcriptional regulator [Spirochaeta thermophila]AEJ61088.1 regulatory protein TetR [Spirochaeta thermophila DSM 6578]
MGTAERRAREKEARRKAILKAARKLFLSRGFLETSMDQIAEECELSKGTLYLYFKNKEELALAIVNQTFDELLARIKEATEKARTGLEALKKVVEAYRRFYEDHVKEFSFAASLEFLAQKIGVKKESIKASYTRVDAILALIIDILKKGIHDGSIRKDIEPEKAAFAVANVIKSFLQRMAVGANLLLLGTNFSEQEIIDYTLSLFLDALSPERSST